MSGAPSVLTAGQRELFPLPISGIYPESPQGADIAFVADAGGNRYYCKRDQLARPVRATEWIATSIASYLKIPVPDFAILLNPEVGETLFGSKEVWGTASRFEAQTFLTTPPSFDPIIGDPFEWLGAYLSRLYAFDLFIGNVDRQICNFLLVASGGSRRLLAFDFASSNLSQIKTTNFAIAQTATLSVGRRWRARREFDAARAFELIDWIGGICPSTLESILAPMPEDWMSSDEREMFIDLWGSGACKVRLAALRRGLSDGSLL